METLTYCAQQPLLTLGPRQFPDVEGMETAEKNEDALGLIRPRQFPDVEGMETNTEVGAHGTGATGPRQFPDVEGMETPERMLALLP